MSCCHDYVIDGNTIQADLATGREPESIEVYLPNIILPAHPSVHSPSNFRRCVAYSSSRSAGHKHSVVHTMSVPKPRTLYQKLFDEHVAVWKDNGTALLYIGAEQPLAW